MSYATFSASKALSTSRVIVTQVVVRAEADAVVDLHDATDATGSVVIPLAIKAGQTVSISGRIAFNTGIYANVASGTVVGTVMFE